MGAPLPDYRERGGNALDFPSFVRLPRSDGFADPIEKSVNLFSRFLIEFVTDRTSYVRVFEDTLFDEQVFFDREKDVQTGLHIAIRALIGWDN